MNEDQLADMLAQQLDALLEGNSPPEEVSPEVAELLALAQNLTEVAPTPRPEFGLALKESLLGPMSAGNGPVEPGGSISSAGSVFGNHMLLIIVVSLVGLAVLLTLVIGAIVFRPPAPTPVPVQTGEVPAQATPLPASTLPASVPPATSVQLDSTLSPPSTATPILDILPPITVTVEITVAPPALVPGSGGGSSDGGNGGSGSGGGGDGDHDRGHGNDPDHNDEDNPGRSGGDD